MYEYYLYDATYIVVVESERHDTCLFEYNRIKYLARAFNASIKESKSARKGPVLRREIRVSFKAGAHESIIFREALDIIIASTNLWNPHIKAQSYPISVERENASFHPLE